MIHVEGLKKTYHTGWAWWKTQTSVLKGFDFMARPGEVTGIVGPNGAGKTTFFRILCGLEKADAGTVMVDGLYPLADPQSMRGRIALLPEEPGVNRDMAGRQHLWMFGAMMGMRAPEIVQALRSCDELLDLSSFWKRSFVTYSRGQRARIALARMNLMSSASVFIFDEPSNGLDFEAVARLHGFIRHLAREGKTVLVTSHILSDLQHVCNRLVGIDGGKTATEERLSAWLTAHAQTQAGVPWRVEDGESQEAVTE